MCLSPLEIINKTKVFGRNLNQRFFCDVPCGHCSECYSQKREEWYLRSYYQAKKYIDNDGWMLFDTLTYRHSELPHLSDFTDKIVPSSKDDYTCFNRDHIRKFLVRLRRTLSYHNCYPEDNLTYFIASEYGHDNWYVDDRGRIRKGTEAPHYHILFFVSKDANLHPWELSFYIDRCWQKGRTDGHMYPHPPKNNKPYNFWDHVYSKRTFKHLATESIASGSDAAIRAVTSYVTKYVVKNVSFDSRIKERLYQLYEDYFGEDPFSNSEDLQKEYKDLCRQVSNFHVQSQDFGTYLFSDPDFDYDNLLKTGKITVPDKNQVKKDIFLPLYLERKLFFKNVKNSDGTWQWIATPESYDWIMSKFYRNLDDFVDRWKDFRYSLSDELVQRFDSLLGTRSLRTFGIYCLAYKGRVRSQRSLRAHVPDDLDTVVFQSRLYCKDDFVRDIFVSQFNNQNYKVHKLNEKEHTFSSDFAVPDFVSSFSFDRFTDTFASFISSQDISELLNVVNYSTYSEDSFPMWKNFDVLYDMYNFVNNPRCRNKDSASLKKQLLSTRLRLLGYDVPKQLY